MHELKAAGRCTKEDLDRWYEDGTIDLEYAKSAIKADVLQLIASHFVGQPSQEAAGQSEMSDGINKAIAAREKSRAYWSAKYHAPTKGVRKKRKPAALAKSGNGGGNEPEL